MACCICICLLFILSLSVCHSIVLVNKRVHNKASIVWSGTRRFMRNDVCRVSCRKNRTWWRGQSSSWITCRDEHQSTWRTSVRLSTTPPSIMLSYTSSKNLQTLAVLLQVQVTNPRTRRADSLTKCSIYMQRKVNVYVLHFVLRGFLDFLSVSVCMWWIVVLVYHCSDYS